MTQRGLPLYRRAADDILGMIASGEFAAGFTVPEAARLAGVKDWAARKAAEHLAGRGLVEAHQGSGYRPLVTPEEAAAARGDARPLREQVEVLQRDMAGLRHQVAAMGGASGLADVIGRLEANLIELYGRLGFTYPDSGDGTTERVASHGSTAG